MAMVHLSPYMTLHELETLPESPAFPGPAPQSSDTTPCSIYQEFAPTPLEPEDDSPFTLPPFSYSGPAPQLLTPSSTASSPLASHLNKPMAYYQPNIDGPQPDKPSFEATRMFHQWNGQFELNNGLNARASPANGQQSVHDFMVNGGVSDGRATPAPPEAPYMGNYGVSTQGNSQQSGYQDIYPMLPLPHAGGHGPALLRGIGSTAMNMPNDRNASSDPVLYQSRLEQQPGLINRAIRQPFVMSPPEPLAADTRHRTMGDRPESKQAKATKRQRSTPRSESKSVGPVQEYHNCHGEEVIPTIAAKCPDEERLMIELRWKHRHAKGADMWDLIQSEYQQVTRKRPKKEMLQMKFKRARPKWLVWDEKDNEILRAVFRIDEEERYRRIHEAFIRRGGSQNMLLNSTDIEVRLCELGLEEGIYMEDRKDSNIRRRRKTDSRKQSSGTGNASSHRGTYRSLAMDPDGTRDGGMSPGSFGIDEIIDQVQRTRRSDSANSMSFDRPMHSTWSNNDVAQMSSHRIEQQRAPMKKRKSRSG